jgi:hypothetical protein
MFCVAGNHVFRAARSLGWTEIAANVEAMDDATAYIPADNRTADLGSYDDDLLAAILAEQAAADNLAATAYDAGPPQASLDAQTLSKQYTSADRPNVHARPRGSLIGSEKRYLGPGCIDDVGMAAGLAVREDDLAAVAGDGSQPLWQRLEPTKVDITLTELPRIRGGPSRYRSCETVAPAPRCGPPDALPRLRNPTEKALGPSPSGHAWRSGRYAIGAWHRVSWSVESGAQNDRPPRAADQLRLSDQVAGRPR